ncbi:tRNA epoxyqueuosine(34) reductase QueG [Azospira restricta]|uniref:Epoxyqueuosine reductase n=2 Tax=Azospira restricta TaxID=404405 RepID=A0A974PXW3_9RHOO|nr:tRNA epoxyqueuosine(34) reductase QueG [Azospira restricta]
MAEGAQHRAHQRRLAGAEVAVEVHHHPRPQARRQPFRERDARRLVRQGHGKIRRNGRLGAMQEKDSAVDWAALAARIKDWGRELGFAEVGIARADPSEAVPGLMRWLEQGRHGVMDYMAKHAPLRADPAALHPGTTTVVTARLPYWPDAADAASVLADGALAYVSRYALGRDYHKTIRSRLQKLADRIRGELPEGTDFNYRAFSDSAPVMEVEFARLAGTAWRGKHTLSLTRGGSYHFLGELYTDLPLPPDAPIAEHCGSCRACLDICPTQAIVAPYEVDARRCISYLTIELDGAIPEALRPLLGNRIYGCDDCQLVCPWNRFATVGDPDFAPRHGLDAATLAELFAWSEAEFEQRLQGSPIRRIGHERWLRNLAVALGNAPATAATVAALEARDDHPSPLVREHVAWALARQRGK